MVPPSTVSRDDNIGRFVSLVEDIVVGGDDVLQRGRKSILRDGGETIPRRGEQTLAPIPRVHSDGAEQLDEKVCKWRLDGVAGDVGPAMHEENDVGVCDVRSRLCFEPVAAEGEEIHGDTLWGLERVAGEEGVWMWGRRGEFYMDGDITRDSPWVRVSNALV